MRTKCSVPWGLEETWSFWALTVLDTAGQGTRMFEVLPDKDCNAKSNISVSVRVGWA